MKALIVVGARPQFIKAAPVSRAFREAGIYEFLVHTGQHYDPSMSEVFFLELGLQSPALNLNAGSGSHAEQTAAMLTGLERAMRDEQPDWVLIFGDTNSTLAGALAAAKLHIPIAHVEAGLRSFNRRMPEEINRIVADSVADLLFVPTETARANLSREGARDQAVIWTGDVMLDAMLMFRERACSSPGITKRLGLMEKGFVLATIHRAENTDDPRRLDAILDGLRRTSVELPVVIPLHPRTAKALMARGRNNLEALQLIEPVGFLDMMRLEMEAAVVATDSGGVQKEAFFHGVPCVTLREETEWTELVSCGWNRLCPPVDGESIAAAIREARAFAGSRPNIYGHGDAANRIAGALQGHPRRRPRDSCHS